MRRALFIIAFVIGTAVAGVGGAALGGILLTGCGNSNPQPVVAPNPNGADCLAARQTEQLDCVQRFSTRAEIDKCIAEKNLPECTTEAGVEAYITSRDAGGN